MLIRTLPSISFGASNFPSNRTSYASSLSNSHGPPGSGSECPLHASAQNLVLINPSGPNGPVNGVAQGKTQAASTRAILSISGVIGTSTLVRPAVHSNFVGVVGSTSSGSTATRP